MRRFETARLVQGAFGALTLLMAGCAAIPPAACPETDWRALGREDGALGRGKARLAEYIEICKSVGVTPDAAAWRAGRDVGLQSFCTDEGAYLAGADGRAYLGVCENESEASRAAYARGDRWLRLDREVRLLQLEIDDHRDEIYALEREAYRARRRGGLRILALTRIPYHEDEIRRLRREIYRLRETQRGLEG